MPTVLGRLRPPRRAVIHLVAITALIGLAIATFGLAVRTPPFGVDNLVGLSLGDVHTPATIWGPESTTSIPSFRPLSRSAVWLQFQLFGVASAQYFAANAAIWIGVGLLAYALVYLEFGSVLGGLAAGALLLSEWRAQEALFWVGERQASMAVLFGLAALLWAYIVLRRGQESPMDRSCWLHIGGVTALLLASGLSKEYGLAFAGAVSTLGLLHVSRPVGRTLFVSGFVALGLYLVMRSVLAGGATTDSYCDEAVGYWGMQITNLCSNDRTSALAVYLVLASFVGTFFPSLFNEEGSLLPATSDQFYDIAVVPLLASAVVASLAIFAWIRLPRRTLPFLALIVGNAALSFLIYRTRNQLVGAVGVYIPAAVGGSIIVRGLVQSAWSRRSHIRLGLGVAAAVVILVPTAMAIGIRAHNLHVRIADYQASVKQNSPCDYYAAALSRGGLGPELSAPVISDIARRWLPDSRGCAASVQPAGSAPTKHPKSSKGHGRPE